MPLAARLEAWVEFKAGFALDAVDLQEFGVGKSIPLLPVMKPAAAGEGRAS